MIMLSETRERFLRAILADIPAERVAEVHFFPPIKQSGVESGVAVVAAWADQPPSEPSETDRHVVYTARYRHTLKGPDRGKWETNVVAEADAPLVTVDAVVRGVQRRAGDVDDPTRMEGDDVRAFAEAHPAPST